MIKTLPIIMTFNSKAILNVFYPGKIKLKRFLPITTEPAKLRSILKFRIFIKSSSFGYIFKFVNQKSKSTVNAIRNTIFPLQVVYIVFDMKTETMT